jgi:hypothetical protein
VKKKEKKKDVGSKFFSSKSLELNPTQNKIFWERVDSKNFVFRTGDVFFVN